LVREFLLEIFKKLSH